MTYRMDASALLKSIAQRYITTKHDLHIIYFVRERQESEFRLPSWTPDWTRSTDRYPLLRFLFSGWMNIIHQASANMNVSFSGDLSEMRVRGLQLDTLGRYATSGSVEDIADQHAKSVFPSICLAAHFVLPSQNDWTAMPSEYIDLFAKTAACLEAECQDQRFSVRTPSPRSIRIFSPWQMLEAPKHRLVHQPGTWKTTLAHRRSMTPDNGMKRTARC